VLNPVEDLRTRPAPPQNATPVQGSQVLGHVRLAHRDTFDQFRHVLLAFHQGTDNAQAGRGREQAEKFGCNLEHPVIVVGRHLLVYQNMPFNGY
jgi:hypothetical protein